MHIHQNLFHYYKCIIHSKNFILLEKFEFNTLPIHL